MTDEAHDAFNVAVARAFEHGGALQALDHDGDAWRVYKAGPFVAHHTRDMGRDDALVQAVGFGVLVGLALAALRDDDR